MKWSGVALAFVAATSPVFAQAAPRVATTLTGTELSSLEQIRKAVWVDWFSGDTASLRRALGPELVAMNAGGTHWQSLEETIAASAKFKADGGKLVSISFDSSAAHRFGNTVVMFSHYVLVAESKEGRSTRRGRATEVFVRAHGRWVHTSWHLDVAGARVSSSSAVNAASAPTLHREFVIAREGPPPAASEFVAINEPRARRNGRETLLGEMSPRFRAGPNGRLA